MLMPFFRAARRFIPLLLCGALAFTLCTLFSCSRNDDFLAWNRDPLSFVGTYEENGITFTCRFSLSGQNGKRTATAEILLPKESAGVVYRLEDNKYSAAYNGMTLPLTSVPAALDRLFLCLPENPVLQSVTTDGITKSETVLADGGTYVFRYNGGPLPSEITCDSGMRHTRLRLLSDTE